MRFIDHLDVVWLEPDPTGDQAPYYLLRLEDHRRFAQRLDQYLDDFRLIRIAVGRTSDYTPVTLVQTS